MNAPVLRQVKAGLIGDGIQGSRSPALHEMEGAAQGFDLTYERFDLADGSRRLEDVIAETERNGFAGLNITYPYKQAVIPLLDELSPDAARLGAVNTVIFVRGRRVGHNTDWIGFRKSFQLGLPDVRKGAVVQLGAGGAGVAVAYALLDSGVTALSVFDLDKSRANELVEKLGALFRGATVAVADDLAAAVSAADGLVNATPIGMARHPGSPVPPTLLRAEMWVADIVYVPIETELLRTARRQGCRVLDGGGMVVFQAAEAFRLFTGREPDAERMRARFLKDLAEDGYRPADAHG